MTKTFTLLTLLFCINGTLLYGQVCDDLIVQGCESSLANGWIKIDNCQTGAVSLQYCHPRFYVGSGHNLSVEGGSMGKIIFDEFIDKTRLNSGIKVRKAVGKNEQNNFYTGIFTYNADNDIDACYMKAGADRSQQIKIPN